MRRARTILVIPIVLLAAWIAALVAANRFYTPPALEHTEVAGRSSDAPLPAEGFRITTWNVGYAGMGEEADFIMDGGEQARPENASLVEKNAAGIAGYLTGNPADIFLFQETAAPSSNNFRYDLNAKLKATLSGYQHTFAADAETRLVPPPLDVHVGNMIFSKYAVTGAELRALPQEPTYVYGLFRKSYAMQVMRLSDAAGRRWVIVNLHLSAFDSDEHHVREKQLMAVMDFAKSEYERGAHVIVGGDWNLRLAPVEFAHKTPEPFLFWIRDLPSDATPQGWRWALDTSRPTVRTAHQPYVKGENATLIIDGFLCSPNVEFDAVSTANLGFQYTDHHPVAMNARSRQE